MSTLKVNAIQNTSGVEQYLAKAWVNFNGTGTVAIRGSGNVSSITDNGTGDYTVNFTNAMADANYAVLSLASAKSGAQNQHLMAMEWTTVPTTSLVRVKSISVAGTPEDDPYVYVAIFR